MHAGFTVETLQKLEVSENAQDFMGVTSDDVYLFRSGVKTRFMGDRRMSCVDAGLSRDGKWVAAGFSDMAGNSYALALGDIAGRVVWARDVDSPLTAVVISRDGGRIVYATENGMLRLVDASRRDVWVFEIAEAATAIACSTDGSYVVYGTAAGAIGWIDGGGKRRWEAALAGEVRTLTLSGDGALCAALVRQKGETSTDWVCLIGDGGHIEWEYPLDRPATGLALSPSGRFFATGARDGSLALYEIIPGAGGGASTSPAIEDLAVSSSGRIRYADASELLRELAVGVTEHPADLALFEKFLTLRTRLRDDLLTSVGEMRENKDFASAIEEIQSALSVDPEFSEALEALRHARKDLAGELLELAAEADRGGDMEGTEALLLRAIHTDLDSREARTMLVSLRDRRALALDAEAKRLLEQKEFDAGIAALEKAQSYSPSSPRGASLEQARTAQEFARGMVAYEEKRYREAVFQFKKVLNRDASHGEARRHLGYAQKFAQDATLDAVNDRFSKLE